MSNSDESVDQIEGLNRSDIEKQEQTPDQKNDETDAAEEELVEHEESPSPQIQQPDTPQNHQLDEEQHEQPQYPESPTTHYMRVCPLCGRWIMKPTSHYHLKRRLIRMPRVAQQVKEAVCSTVRTLFELSQDNTMSHSEVSIAVRAYLLAHFHIERVSDKLITQSVGDIFNLSTRDRNANCTEVELTFFSTMMAQTEIKLTRCNGSEIDFFGEWIPRDLWLHIPSDDDLNDVGFDQWDLDQRTQTFEVAINDPIFSATKIQYKCTSGRNIHQI
uniref:Uncharacterized protein n=1 Tax=Romanomermis culicivorax TaxID=13658 RepID=A0A915JZ22_ROMCU